MSGVYNKNITNKVPNMYTEKRVIRPNDEVVRYYCDNGYGLSVACHEHSYGGSEGLYEIALLKDDKLHYDDEWTDVRRLVNQSRGLELVENCFRVLNICHGNFNRFPYPL